MASIRDLPATAQALLLIEQVPGLAFIITDAEGMVSLWSSGMERLTGWARHEMVGRPFDVIFTPEDREAGIPAAEMDMARGGAVVPNARWLVARDGTPFFADGVLAPLRTADGPIAGFAKTLRDSTSAIRLQESEAKFRAMVNATPHMVWSALPDGAGDYFNERMVAFTGIPLAQLQGPGWADLVHPEDREDARRSWTACLQTGEPLSIEFRFRHVSGEYRWVLCRGEPVRDHAGRITRWMGTNTDIHERKMAQARLAESEERFRTLVTATSQAVWVSGATGEILQESPSWHAFTGQAVDDLRERGWIHALHPDDRERALAVWTEATGRRGAYELECRVRHVSGDYRWATARGVPVLDRDGSIREWVGTFTDITDKKKTEAALQEARMRLEATLTAGEVAVFTWDIGADKVYSDESMIRLHGVTAQDIDGGPSEVFFRSIHPDDLDAARATVEHAVATGQPYQAAYRVVLPDGEHRSVQARGKVEFSPEGTPQWMIGIVIDITPLKAAEEELRRQGQRYRTLFSSIEEGFYIVELVFDEAGRAIDHRYLEANASVARITGFQDVVGKLATDLIPSYDPAWRDLYLRVLETGEPGQVLVEVPKWQKWLDFSVTRLGAREENKLAVLMRDITERKRNEDALRYREERYRALFNSIDEGFYIVELIFDESGVAVDYRFLEANPAAERHNGLRDPVGKTLRESVPNPRMDWVERYAEVMRKGVPEHFSEYSPTLGRWFDVSVTRLGDASSRQIAILFNDVTQRKHNEEELHRLASDLSQANRRQNEFLATLAHELRNPLAPIRTGLDLIAAGMEVAPPVAKVHEIMNRQVDHLVSLVDDLLDLARITSGKIELKKSRHLLREILHRAVETSLPAIEAKGHRLVQDIDDDAVWVDADVNRLGQVIGNLLTNAAKYTPQGGRIVLSLKHANNVAVISVSDNGIGIAAEDIPNLFDMFSQVRRGLGHAEGGLGIGLNLVRQLTEKHGGTVTVDSPGPNQGSTFTIRLPIEQRESDIVDAGTPPPAGRQARRPLHILVADDNVDAADTLKDLLEVSGHLVQVARDGAEAWELMNSCRPDLAFLDIGMPKMNGYEVAQATRAAPELRHVVLAAVTGWGAQEDQARSFEAGFNHHLAKPVSFERIQELIAGIPG